LSFILVDGASDEDLLYANNWHWHAIVEAMRALDVLPEPRVQALHVGFSGNGLTRDEARAVAAALRQRLLPALADAERLLLDQTRTTTPDDGVMHYEPGTLHLNYSTDRAMLERFATACETCDGFKVL
jgi:hypothetical protein